MYYIQDLHVLYIVSVVVRLWAVCSRNCGLIPSRGKNYMYIFLKASRPASEPIQPLIRWVPGNVFFWSRVSGHEADDSPSS